MIETTQERYPTPITNPSFCLSVTLTEITMNEINLALERLYLKWRVDPQYMFCSKQDYEKIDAEVDRCTNYRISPSDPNWVRHPATVWCNQTTGKLMHIVILPKLEDGTLMFGFITY